MSQPTTSNADKATSNGVKMLYATSNKYPSFKYANTGQILAMSKSFADYLGRDFYLGGKNINPESGSLIQTVNFHTVKSYVLGYKFIKFIKEKDIEAVYCREARLLFFIILYNKLFFRVKLRFIYEIHALVDRSIIDKIIEKALALGVDNFIFITKNLRDIYIKKYRIPENKTLVCPDAVDLSIFDINLTKQEARQKLGLPEGKKIIAYTGKFKTMGMDKGLSDILKSLAYLPPDIIFLAIGGSQEDIAYYQKEAEELKVDGRVKFIGHVSQGELAIYQKSADILLMPFPFNQHYAYYMSPLKMFEYMASKRPIIASDLPSVREVLSAPSINSGQGNAIIVKPDDPEDLARGIKEIFRDKELANQISQQAFRDVDNYTWEKRVESILDFIK